MEKYAKKLQDIINEQDFCFEPEEIKTVEKALGVLRMYEDANIPAEACAEYRKFEDELIRDGMSLQHVLDLLKAEKEGRLKVRPESLGQCCGQCHHFLREPMKASGICEVRKNKHYPRAGFIFLCLVVLSVLCNSFNISLPPSNFSIALSYASSSVYPCSINSFADNIKCSRSSSFNSKTSDT